MAERIDQATARRIALAAQGFGRDRSGRVDVRHFRAAMRDMGVLQLDSVNVVVRSHYLPVFSRVGSYDHAALDRYTAHSSEIFEYWGHEASLLPVDLYPSFRWRMDDAAVRPWRRAAALMREHPGYIESVEDQIRDEGALSVSDLHDRGERTGNWWGWGPGKIALEYLFAVGRISAYRGRQFTRVYDLAERIVPAEHFNAPVPDREAAYRRLLLKGARHHGIGTGADIGDYYRLHMPTARPILRDLAAEGALIEVEVPGWRGPVYLHPDAVRARSSRGTALLSPFDPVVWYRDRAERLFGFHYRIEIYVPEPKRRFGYYVLPFLLDGDLVGRVDLKAHRSAGVLEVRSAFHEEDVSPSVVAGPLCDELELLAGWLGLDSVSYGDRGNLVSALAKI